MTLHERALQLAGEIAGNAPLAQLGQQAGDPRSRRSSRAALDPELERELIELRRPCFSSEDFREGVRAFAEKRPPQWQAQ